MSTTGAHGYPVAEALRRAARALRSEAGLLDPTSENRTRMLDQAKKVDKIADLYDRDASTRDALDYAVSI